jgi:hypothetical protein
VVAGYVVDDVPMLMMGEVKSPYCYIGEAWKIICVQPNNKVCLLAGVENSLASY